MYTKKFNRITSDDVSLAGGKGASLGEMTRVKMPVPPGFVILTNAFDKFLEETDLGVNIDAILKRVKHSNLNSV